MPFACASRDDHEQAPAGPAQKHQDADAALAGAQQHTLEGAAAHVHAREVCGRGAQERLSFRDRMPARSRSPIGRAWLIASLAVCLCLALRRPCPALYRPLNSRLGAQPPSPHPNTSAASTLAPVLTLHRARVACAGERGRRGYWGACLRCCAPPQSPVRSGLPARVGSSAPPFLDFRKPRSAGRQQAASDEAPRSAGRQQAASDEAPARPRVFLRGMLTFITIPYVVDPLLL